MSHPNMQIVEKIRNLCIQHPEKIQATEDDILLTIGKIGKINKMPAILLKQDTTQLKNILWKVEKVILNIKD